MERDSKLRAIVDKICRAAGLCQKHPAVSEISRAVHQNLPPGAPKLDSVQKLAEWYARTGGDL